MAAFSSGPRLGAAEIDAFLHYRALPEQQAGWCRVTVAIDPAAQSLPQVIVGFFSLSPLSLPVDERVTRALGLVGVYPQIPGYLLGRLGVAADRQGAGLGRALVERAVDAASKARGLSGGVPLAVDAKDEGLVEWYAQLGFARLMPERRWVVLSRDALR